MNISENGIAAKQGTKRNLYQKIHLDGENRE
jgi:hypothetical protein